MGTRVDLHYKLVDILGSSNVYFQPPASITMRYPAIVYSLDNIQARFANNMPYNQKRRYKITYITKDPDSELIDIFPLKLPSVDFDRVYTADNLYHYVYTIYY
jgi:hypothetical protein